MMCIHSTATFRIRQATRQNISDQTRDALKAEVYDVLSLLCLSATLYQLQHRGNNLPAHTIAFLHSYCRSSHPCACIYT